MAELQKRVATNIATAECDRKVRDTVEAVLADKEVRGDVVAKSLSQGGKVEV